jgi:hypothetical protein
VYCTEVELLTRLVVLHLANVSFIFVVFAFAAAVPSLFARTSNERSFKRFHPRHPSTALLILSSSEWTLQLEIEDGMISTLLPSVQGNWSYTLPPYVFMARYLII